MRAFAALLLLCTTPGRAEAQIDAAEVHARVVDFIKTRAPRTLPAGDTLVSWNGDRPVLFHTASRNAAGVQAGMLRADRMLGIADVRLEGTTPMSFSVQWLTPGPTATDSLTIRGTLKGDTLRITRAGQRDTSLVVPRIPWAVADYGMEELLLPLFDAVSQSGTTTVAVFRPYGMKWDSLKVSVGQEQNGWRVLRWIDEKNESWTATVQGPHLLWVRRSEHSDNEKLPLEGTAARQIFDRLRADVELASRPSRPNER